MSKKITNLNKTTSVADANTGEFVTRKVYELEDTKTEILKLQINTEIVKGRIKKLEEQKTDIEAELVDLNDTLGLIED